MEQEIDTKNTDHLNGTNKVKAGMTSDCDEGELAK
jgi:hypothetical protein